ncbi:hypothetical protein CYMTET_45023 [Cymbomonas tetramitiformis]|uniref:Uncharacterized protein n=1 Tax=Cymbomonas tetramitiformis TaxID=36881 RepID=A0AAE0EYR0_9CHLO|nr:hypothetical protein CYMTET_45023 [Cymbomonas tetramitiformis]
MDQTQLQQPGKEHRGCAAEAQPLPQRHAANLPPQQLSAELPQQQLIVDAATTALLPQHLLSVAVGYASTAHRDSVKSFGKVQRAEEGPRPEDWRAWTQEPKA